MRRASRPTAIGASVSPENPRFLDYTLQIGDRQEPVKRRLSITSADKNLIESKSIAVTLFSKFLCYRICKISLQSQDAWGFYGFPRETICDTSPDKRRGSSDISS